MYTSYTTVLTIMQSYIVIPSIIISKKKIPLSTEPNSNLLRQFWSKYYSTTTYSLYHPQGGYQLEGAGYDWIRIQQYDVSQSDHA